MGLIELIGVADFGVDDDDDGLGWIVMGDSWGDEQNPVVVLDESMLKFSSLTGSRASAGAPLHPNKLFTREGEMKIKLKRQIFNCKKIKFSSWICTCTYQASNLEK